MPDIFTMFFCIVLGFLMGGISIIATAALIYIYEKEKDE